MPSLLQEVEYLLTIPVFSALIKTDVIKISQLNTVIALLIKANIPFQLDFSRGTRQDKASAELSISINPNTSLEFTFTFESSGVLPSPGCLHHSD